MAEIALVLVAFVKLFPRRMSTKSNCTGRMGIELVTGTSTDASTDHEIERIIALVRRSGYMWFDSP